MGDAEGQSGVDSPVFFLDENHCGNKHLHAVFRAAGLEFAFTSTSSNVAQKIQFGCLR